MRTNPPQYSPGQLIGERYRVLHAFESGRLGRVHVCAEVGSATIVAVKVFRRELSRDADCAELLLRQAEAARLLTARHPGLLAVHGCERTPAGELCLVTEYIKGRTLRDVIRTDGPLDVARAVRLAGQIADALDAGHRQGIVHGQLCPEQILLAGVGETEAVRLKGFESRGVDEIGALAAMRGAGFLRIRPHYLSPEQIEGDRVSPRTDVYALGAILYEMLSGSPPFRDATPDGVLAQQLQAEPAPLRTGRPEIPPVVELKVGQALEKEPGKRQRYVGDLANQSLTDLALEEMAQAAERSRPWPLRLLVGVRRGWTREDTDEEEDAPAARRILAAIAVLLVLALVGASVVWTVREFWIPAVEEWAGESPRVSGTPASLPAAGAREHGTTTSRAEPPSGATRAEPTAAAPITEGVPPQAESPAAAPSDPKRLAVKPAPTIRDAGRRERDRRAGSVAGAGIAPPAPSAPPPRPSREQSESPDPGAIIDWLFQQGRGNR
jgi:serine/threonine-protein kinase